MMFWWRALESSFGGKTKNQDNINEPLVTHNSYYIKTKSIYVYAIKTNTGLFSKHRSARAAERKRNKRVKPLFAHLVGEGRQAKLLEKTLHVALAHGLLEAGVRPRGGVEGREAREHHEQHAPAAENVDLHGIVRLTASRTIIYTKQKQEGNKRPQKPTGVRRQTKQSPTTLKKQPNESDVRREIVRNPKSLSCI